MTKNFQDFVISEMESDIDYEDQDGDSIFDMYEGATENQKRMMDHVTICLTGWTIESLKKRFENQ